MSGKAVGRTAAALPWLCPNTDSLIRLAEAPAALARPCDADPALLAFLLRFTSLAAQPYTSLFCQSSLASAVLPEAAGALLAATPDGWVPAGSEVAKRCRAFSAAAAAFARRLAERTHRTCPDRVCSVVALAPLGWLAVAAVDSGVAAEPLHDPDTPPLPSVQADVWGLDQNAIARRLANRWRLPAWVATALGNLTLPLAAARTVVADIGMFAVAQLAVLEAERRVQALGLSHGANREAILEELALSETAVDELWTAGPPGAGEPQSLSVYDPNPHKVPLLANLLKMAAESRRRNGTALVARLEDRMDDLHRAIVQVGDDVETRAWEARLAALAEVAAGAGHEINNPLAIISGNAQRLVRTEPEPQRGESLQVIIRQTERIAGIIRDLMQFARPPRPNPRRCSVFELVNAVRAELASFASEKGVRLELSLSPDDAHVRCDYAQVRYALAAVVKNGIEAAGRDGWVRLSSSEGDAESACFVIEDSGPGLSGPIREHCFDPFYCGRSAGRGRGLGLSTAWQFVRQNGGELRHEPSNDGPTRFVLTVPRSITLDFLDRQSA